MPTNAKDDPVMIRFRQALDAIDGNHNFERIILFGSRARGDSQLDSDYDIAVFIKNFGGLLKEIQRLAAISTDILMDTGKVISAKPFRAEDYETKTAFMRNLRRDGACL
jgi:predicted nucleotidyltransferase